MKKINFLLALLVICFITSCKKDEDDPQNPSNPPVVVDDYTPYKTGNYWIYQQYVIDTNGIDSATATFDSCYVAGDTVVNGVTYTKLVEPYEYSPGQLLTQYVRDSLNYLVDISGRILFSSDDFTSDLYTHTSAYNGDTVFVLVAKMVDKDVMTTVPAGTFTTSDYLNTYYMYAPFNNYGNRLVHHRYGRNIGTVTKTVSLYASDPFYRERRLIRYHLN